MGKITDIQDQIWEINAHLKRRDDNYEIILKEMFEKLKTIEEVLKNVKF